MLKFYFHRDQCHDCYSSWYSPPARKNRMHGIRLISYKVADRSMSIGIHVGNRRAGGTLLYVVWV